ncbi:unnamed protein product [Cochlearia groenlandica]
MAQDTQKQGTPPYQSRKGSIFHVEPATQSHQKIFQHIPQDSIDNIPMHTDAHKNLNVDKPEQDCTPLRNETIHMDTDNHAPAEKEESRQLHNRSWLLADELEAVATPSAHPLLASITGAQGKVIAEGVDQSARQTMEIAAAINNVVIQASLLPTKESSANNSGWEECMVEVGKCVDNILAGTTSDAAKKIIQPIVLINSSPTHQKPRNIPTSLEVQLATILQIHTQHWTASRLTTTSYWTWQHPLPGYPHRYADHTPNNHMVANHGGWKRPILFTKRRRSGDCGPVSMKLMELHAYGDPPPTMAGLRTDHVGHIVLF